MDNLSMRDFVRCSPLRLAAGLGLLFGLALAPTASPAELEEVSVPITAQEVGKAAEVRSLGATHRYYRLRVKPGDKVSVPFIATEVALLQTESVRLFFLDQSEGAWRVVSESRFDPKKGVMVASGVPGPGVYTVFGASRLADAYELQRGLCQGRDTARVVPQICTRIYCPADGLAELAEDILAEAPPGVGPGDLGVALGDTCQQCLLGSGEPREFPECQISELARPPALPIDLSGLIPWPRACFDAGNACIPGPYKVGQVDYNFEDELDLIPPGMTQPAYPDVDVRATVRYPAANTGVQQPVAGTGLYPLVLFLHGNHVTCPCSCSHACAPASRIPNHLGYNYLLDILASWGFVAVSIDGFDVTCAGSFAMSDYEARGWLILHHLGKWKDWNGSTTDPWGGTLPQALEWADWTLRPLSRRGGGRGCRALRPGGEPRFRYPGGQCHRPDGPGSYYPLRTAGPVLPDDGCE
jgi:hypothetical protein